MGVAARAAATASSRELTPRARKRRPTWGFIGFSDAIQAFIVWRLWHGSPLAWFFAIPFATLTPVSLVLMAAPLEFGVILFFVVSIAQAAILCTRPFKPLASNMASNTPGARVPLGR
jgi:hypothetical protein